MKLSNVCIQKPVLAIVLSLVLLVLGIIGFRGLEVRFFPKLTLPIVSIWTEYDGASGPLMESQVTTPIENALASVDGIQYMNSYSYTGWSGVYVQFKLGGDLESQAAQVRDSVSAAQSKLPENAYAPSVTVGTTGNPIIAIGFTAKNKTPAEIRDYVSRNVEPVLRQLTGVGWIDIQGASSYAMRIWLDPQKMASLGVTVTDINSAITANNIYFSAGSVIGPTRSYSLVSNTRLKNANDFSNIIVKQTATGTVRMKDVATVKLGFTSLNNYPMRIDGKNGIMLMVYPLQDANPIKVANEVTQSIEHLKSQLPQGIQAKTSFDLSKFLSGSINETFLAIGEAIILVILVVYLFLGSVRAAFIPIITIPVSLISVFFIIKMAGFTINIMSLLAMVLAIGLVVDDAIVMMENIHRHIERGMSPMQAAFLGSKEIGFAIVAMSITLVAVYAPVGFIEGFNAEVFKEFSFTLASAVVISGFVALTLSPMMCSRILLPEQKMSSMSQWIDTKFNKLSLIYQRLLEQLLQRRVIVIAMFLGFAAAGVGLFSIIHSEFLPQEDYSMMNINIASPDGSSMSYTDSYAKKIEAIIGKIPEIKSFSTQVLRSSTVIRAVMKPYSQTGVSTQQVIAKLNPILDKIPGVNAIAQIPAVVNYGSDDGSDLTLNFMTTGSYQDLVAPINNMMNQLKSYPGLMNVQTNLNFNSQQYSIEVDRDLAAAVGVSLQDIANTVSAMMSGNHITDVEEGNESYPVMVQMPPAVLKNFDAVKQLYVESSNTDANGDSGVKMIPLSSLITLTPSIGQGTFTHFNRMRSGSITAILAPGYTESQIVKYVQQHVSAVLTPTVRYAFSGKAQQYLDSSGSMAGIVLMSFIFIYLVLSAQFGSFIDPFVILLAVPLSMVGGMFALWCAGGTLNLFSQIGLVTLIGMISKHGILITQFINDLREKGNEINQAILKAAAIRFRPIIMTTLAMIFGTLPLVLAIGSGSSGRNQIGWVIIGGLIFGTFFSLIVVPVAYSYLGRLKKITVTDE